MAELPEFIYLITVETQWMVSAIAGDHPNTPERVVAEVERRSGTAPGSDARGGTHVWRVPVAGAVEMDIVPGEVIKPSLR
jgi:hypothetical protein